MIDWLISNWSVGKECRKFAKSVNARAVCVYGGTGISEQIAELKRGNHSTNY